MAKSDIKRVLLDTSVLISWIRGEPAAARIAGALNMIDRGEAQLVESVLVLAEVYKQSTAASKSERDQQDAKLATIRAKLESREVELLDVTAPVARRATEYRRQFSLKTPDAVLLATAVLNRCDWLLTLDQDFPTQVEQVRVFRAELLDASVPVPWDIPVQDSLFHDNVIPLGQRSVPRAGQPG